ncbi:MAG: c-type cytochrome, partial [Diaphorobacter nitroreducens]
MLKLETHSPERLRRFPLLCAIAKKVDTAAAKRPLRGARWSGPSRYLAALGLFWLTGLHAQTTEAQPNAPALYQQHCAVCHGAQRTGIMGPALLPESLERVRPAEV